MLYDLEKIRYFKDMLIKVVGQALTAANYTLEGNKTHEERGLFRFRKPLPELGDHIYGFIEWQLLAFEQSPFYRFQITLLRNEGLDARAHTAYSHRDVQTLPYVMLHTFQSPVLPDENYWWSFRYGEDLPPLLAESGKLLFGYGIPWLEMRLT